MLLLLSLFEGYIFSNGLVKEKQWCQLKGVNANPVQNGRLSMLNDWSTLSDHYFGQGYLGISNLPNPYFLSIS